MKYRPIVIALSLVACSNNPSSPSGADASHGSGDASRGGDANQGGDAAGPFTEAMHPAQPTAMSLGASVIAAPKIVPVFFAGDGDTQTSVEDFLTQLAGSTYWPAVSSEYGVGALTIAPSVVATEAAPTTDTALQTLLSSHAAGGSGWPVDDASTIYAVYLPSGTTLTSISGTSCVNFGGYHSSVTGSSVVYALIPRCPAGAFTVLQNATETTSHELLEASTDPVPLTAYEGIDADDVVYRLLPGAELADMCEYQRSAFQPLVGGYLVQRSWSNTSAAAGHDPCVPALATPYVEAAANLSDITISVFGFPFTTRGVQVPMGQSATIELDLYSDAPTADWTVQAFDTASKYQGATTPQLTFSLDHQTGNNGDKVMLTITRAAAGALGFSEIEIESSVNGTAIGTWWAAVSQ